MPWNGAGVFTRLYNWASDYANGIYCRYDRMDGDANDIAQGISNCIARDGQAAPVADISWGTHKLTSLGSGVADSDAVNYGQVFKSPTFTEPTAADTPADGDMSVRLATTAFAMSMFSPAFRGIPTAPTAAVGTNTDQIATMAALQAASFASSLPSISSGVANYLITNDGTTAAWGYGLNAGTIRWVDSTDTTKKLAFDLSNFTTGVTRTITAPNKSGTLAMLSDLLACKPGMAAGRYYTYPFVTALAVSTFTANQLYAVPVLISEADTFTKIGISISLPSGNARLGIYNMDGDGLPSSLVVDAGAIPLSTVGEKEIAINQPLSLGWYYLACEFDNNTVQAVRFDATGAGAFVLGGASTAADVTVARAPVVSLSFGALPSTFGTATLANLNSHPLIWVRK